MTQLPIPDVRLQPSWAEAVAEYGEESMHGSGLWDFDHLDTTEEGCAAVVAHLLAAGRPGHRAARGHACTATTTGSPRTASSSATSRCGTRSPSGCSTRAATSGSRSARRAAARATPAGRSRLALTEAKELGLDRVLLTCDEDNDGSRLTIEGNGGVYEDSRNGKRRYWIDVE